jgi:hypothetical protein
MRSVREHRKKAASRTRKAKGPPVLSTSEARANFADSRDSSSGQCRSGFDAMAEPLRRLPVEAIYMLAGLGRRSPPRAGDRRRRRGVRQQSFISHHGPPAGRGGGEGKAADAEQGAAARAGQSGPKPGRAEISAKQQARKLAFFARIDFGSRYKRALRSDAYENQGGGCVRGQEASGNC